MNSFEIVSSYLDKDIILPTRATADSAGYDIRAAETVTIPSIYEITDHMLSLGVDEETLTMTEIANDTKMFGLRPTLVPTGLKANIDEGHFLTLVPRSSLPLKHWLWIPNSPAVIDRDYYNNEDNEGHIFVQIINFSPVSITIPKGERICQGVFLPYGTIESDNVTTSRTGGFGSTGGN